MNGYYPFLVEKVSKLERSRESRRIIYKSVRDELVTKLASPALRIPEAEIAKECRAFDAAIQTIEAEMERDCISDAGALDSTISRTSSDSPESSKITRIESASTPAIFVGETSPETSAPTTPGTLELAAFAEQQGRKWQLEGELLQANPTGETSRAGDFRVLPQNAVHDSGLNLVHRSPGATVAQTMRKRLISMIFVIVVSCLVFAAVFLSTSIGKWFGL